MSASTRLEAGTPLSSLAQLSPSVYLYEPAERGTRPPDSVDSDQKDETVTATSHALRSPYTSVSLSNQNPNRKSGPSPKLIILVTWMSAHPVHISKYILGYQTHFPTSPILLVRSSPPDLFYRRTQTQRGRVSPAIAAILSCCTTTDVEPELLLHIFSNGGSHQTRNLLRAYREMTSNVMPSHITILDSCPGRGTFKQSVLALSSALPSAPPLRFFLLVIIYVVISVYWIIFIPLGIPDPIERIRQALNDKRLMGRELRRCYIYSEADPMVAWHDIEAHAQDATKRGFVVRSEKFEGSGHCAHVRVAGGLRYWAIVKEMWQARIV